MDTEPWRAISRALDELDAIRVQVRQGQSADRTVRFYDLVRVSLASSQRGGVAAAVIEFAGGWVVCHWPHDPKSVAYYSSIFTARAALCADRVYMLSLTDISERTSPRGTRASHTDTELIPSERKVVALVLQARTNSEIAFALGVKLSVVKNCMSSIFKKTGTRDRTQLALMARDLNLGTLLEDPPEDVGADQ